jgi:hypothetical protein
MDKRSTIAIIAAIFHANRVALDGWTVEDSVLVARDLYDAVEEIEDLGQSE